MKLNFESWCDACGTLWTAVRNCCCGEEVSIITRSWQSSWHSWQSSEATIITWSWQSSWTSWTFSVWRPSMLIASREDDKGVIRTHIYISKEEEDMIYNIIYNIFTYISQEEEEDMIYHTYKYIFLRRRRSLWLEHSRRKARQARLQVRGDKVCHHLRVTLL